MTNEEAIKRLKEARTTIQPFRYVNEAIDYAIKALEQEPFAEWVASEIFNENWEYNKDSFAEITCRKLAKMGIVKENGDMWEYEVEKQPKAKMESEDKK